ncbi:MAG: HD domain-containing protein [Lachnospiraceae bacterium]|jgi:HD-GYP domain-containing protein (c-di-GMP phosphodiesterase class II)|nr:HD domain-containing protein [Lachnospiraceae bacterium]
MRKVPISMLEPEMSLGKSIYNGDSLLLRRGIANLHRYINKLTELDIGHVYIDDEISEGIEVHDAISEDTRNKCKTALSTTFAHVLENDPNKNAIDIEELSDVVDVMIAEILSQPNIVISLQDIGSSRDETLLHSVNSTVYGLVLANRIGINTVAMRDLAQGLLLHDIGKVLLDQEILYKSVALTREEFDHIKQHTKLGYEILKKDPVLTEMTRRVALDHHERLDGSGYAGSRGDELNLLVRISSIVDAYEALTVNRCYRKGYTPSKAADILTADAVDKLDAELLGRFFQCIAIYPNGSLLKLSNGKYAAVKEQNTGVPFRPVIRMIEIEGGKQVAGEEINLAHTLNITVVEDDPDLIANLIKDEMARTKEN